jgi:polysaccharide biosynthesis transport protein
MQANRREMESSPDQHLVRRRQVKPAATSTDLVEYYPAEAFGQGHGYYGEVEDGFDVREFTRKVYRHRWLLITLVTMATTSAAFVAYRAKSIYQASTVLEVLKEGGTLSRSADLASDGDDDDKSINTKMLVFKSQELLEDVVVNLKLNQNHAFTGGRGAEKLPLSENARETSGAETSIISGPGGVRAAAERASLSPYVGLLEKNLKVEQIDDTRAIKISFTHTSPEVAALVADGVAQSFIDRNFQGKTERFTSAQAWLDRSTAELKAKVERAEQALADYVRHNGIFSTEGSSTLTTDKLTKLHDEATRVETDRLLKETLYEEVRQGRVAQLPQIFAEMTAKSKPELGRLQDQVGELQAQEAKLGVRFGPDHPQVREIREQIAQIRSQLEGGRVSLRKELEARLRIEYEHALENERALKAALTRAKGEAVDENQAAITYSILKQDVETSKALYTEFLQSVAHQVGRPAQQHPNPRPCQGPDLAEWAAATADGPRLFPPEPDCRAGPRIRQGDVRQHG